jgi:molybdopterin converting factor subunit 1
MRVRVLYFAALREVAGMDEESLELPASVASVRAFAAFLAEHRPKLASALPHVRIARNERFAAAGEELRDGDVLALIPPVAGG